MKIISQHAKEIMEKCKAEARAAGLIFDPETLEYIVTNQDMLRMSPKIMIPTLYDYWVHDVEVLQGRAIYKAHPHNPYETVINTRPAISFYNDNNPDWLNCMIFYHVLGHIDCFQNNKYFANTWNDDFCGQALADKRMIAELRQEMGEEKRWVDYAIEFARGIDNLVGYYRELNEPETEAFNRLSPRTEFYFGEFLNKQAKLASPSERQKELDQYNRYVREFGESKGEEIFFDEVKKKFVEFARLCEKRLEKKKKEKRIRDLTEYIMEYSEFIDIPKNHWMRAVMQVVRNTSVYFQPQIRTKILNEGWASFWHQRLFRQDEGIRGHEVDYTTLNAGVMQMPRAGLNPYALGCMLLEYLYEAAEKGRLDYAFHRIEDRGERERYDKSAGRGAEFLFHVRKHFNDYQLINFLPDDHWQDFCNRNKLFTVGRRLEFSRQYGIWVWEYYIKSKDGRKYRQMLNDSLYHPPHITVEESKAKNGELYLDHEFEGRQLVTEWIPNTMIGIEYLWGKPVHLETTEFVVKSTSNSALKYMWGMYNPDGQKKIVAQRVLYTMRDRKLERKEL